jgi:hypothetical protein
MRRAARAATIAAPSTQEDEVDVEVDPCAWGANIPSSVGQSWP